MKRWDVFISHASEDKEVVWRLATGLASWGLKVWLDAQQLTLGDSLREKIDEGLAQSRYGVVVISKNFIAKDWPKRELNAMLSLEKNGRKVILPIWHDIDHETVSKFSPLVADRLAANTNDLRQTVKAIAETVIDQSISARKGLLSPKLTLIIENSFDPLTVRSFLLWNRKILERVINTDIFSKVEVWGRSDVPPQVVPMFMLV